MRFAGRSSVLVVYYVDPQCNCAGAIFQPSTILAPVDVDVDDNVDVDVNVDNVDDHWLSKKVHYAA